MKKVITSDCRKCVDYREIMDNSSKNTLSACNWGVSKKIKFLVQPKGPKQSCNLKG